MERQPARRSSLFLMELIIAILFFSLAAAVCVRFFVKSRALEQDSINLNHAVTAATSVAEILRNQEDPYPFLAKQFPDGEMAESSYQFFYNENWQLCDKVNAIYTVSLDTKYSENFQIGNIQVTEDEYPIYELAIKNYIKREALSNEN